jgi:hypothetical protein
MGAMGANEVATRLLEAFDDAEWDAFWRSARAVSGRCPT